MSSVPPPRKYPPPPGYELFGRGRGAMPRSFAKILPPGSLNSIELAWATGLFEGEGGTTSERNGSRPMLHVSQSGSAETPPQVLMRFLAAVGGVGAVYGPQLRPPRQPKWQYRASGVEAVEYIIGLMDPWLGDVKRHQATAVLSKARELRSSRRLRPGNHFGRPLQDFCVRGHPLADAYVDRRGARYCRECRRERERDRRRRRMTQRKLEALPAVGLEMFGDERSGQRT